MRPTVVMPIVQPNNIEDIVGAASPIQLLITPDMWHESMISAGTGLQFVDIRHDAIRVRSVA